MDLAKEFAMLSTCNKRPVGAVVVKDGRVIGYGFNHGYDETCHCSMTEKNPHVLHAEKMALCGDDRHIYRDAILYVTYPPCPDCMTLIRQCKIKEVIHLQKGEFPE